MTTDVKILSCWSPRRATWISLVKMSCMTVMYIASALEISTELRYIHRSGSSSRSEFAWYAHAHTRK